MAVWIIAAKKRIMATIIVGAPIISPIRGDSSVNIW